MRRGEESRGPAWWRLGFGLAVVVGLVCAAERWGWQLSAASALSAGFTAIIVWLPFVEGELPATHQFIGRAMVAGCSVTAAAGLVVVGGGAGAVVVLLVAGSSPYLRRLLRSPRARAFLDLDPEPDAVSQPPGREDPVAERTEPLPDAVGLDDAELCLAWRQSFVVLEDCDSAPTHLEVVRRRQEYLDEMQRRNPDGFAAWIASGARAASNPLPFLGTSTAAHPLPSDSSKPGDDPPDAERLRG